MLTEPSGPSDLARVLNQLVETIQRMLNNAFQVPVSQAA
jgi:hypothetical protein